MLSSWFRWVLHGLVLFRSVLLGLTWFRMVSLYLTWSPLAPLGLALLHSRGPTCSHVRSIVLTWLDFVSRCCTWFQEGQGEAPGPKEKNSRAKKNSMWFLIEEMPINRSGRQEFSIECMACKGLFLQLTRGPTSRIRHAV